MPLWPTESFLSWSANQRNAVKLLRTQIDRRPIESFLSKTIIINYQALGQSTELAEFIGTSESTNSQQCREESIIAQISSRDESKAPLYRINLYGLSRSYFAAVNLAIDSLQKEQQTNSAEIERLAYKWASKHEKLEIRKKLWLQIAAVHRRDESKIKEMLKRKDCPLKITDVLGLLGENDDVSSYKTVG